MYKQYITDCVVYKMQQQFKYNFTRRHAPECLVVSNARTQTAEGNAATKCNNCMNKYEEMNVTKFIFTMLLHKDPQKTHEQIQ